MNNYDKLTAIYAMHFELNVKMSLFESDDGWKGHFSMPISLAIGNIPLQEAAAMHKLPHE